MVELNSKPAPSPLGSQLDAMIPFGNVDEAHAHGRSWRRFVAPRTPAPSHPEREEPAWRLRRAETCGEAGVSG